MRIEFRQLYFVPSHFADDRFAVGLLHWDGTTLRFAHSAARLPPGFREYVPMLERELEGIALRVSKAEPQVGTRLAQAFPVTEGRGPSLLWTDVRVGESVDSAADFEELRTLIGLPLPSTPMAMVARKSIQSTLKKLA